MRSSQENSSKSKTACVTGAAGMVGSRIVHHLLQQGYKVRALTRRRDLILPGVDMHYGDIQDLSVLKLFLHSADLLFHCAAELSNESKMWDVNVRGTETLLDLIPESEIQLLCYLSSAGVIGKTEQSVVDETTLCNPSNIYEYTKWEAEKRVAEGIDGCRTIILRPTNVINSNRPGALELPMQSRWVDYIKIYLKGGENAHIIHADDVAAAALFLTEYATNDPQCFFVSCDHEPQNTFAGIWKLCKSFEQTGAFCEDNSNIVHLPIFIPRILRNIVRRTANRGDIVYSSAKLLRHGFSFPLGLRGAIMRIFEDREQAGL